MTTAPASSAVYKWVDEHGVTQYSETPPPDQEAAAMRLLPSPSREATEEAIRSLEQRLAETRKRDARDKAIADISANRAAAKRAAYAERCLYAKQDLMVLQEQVRAFHFNEKGERVYINDQDRASRIQSLREFVSNNCE